MQRQCAKGRRNNTKGWNNSAAILETSLHHVKTGTVLVFNINTHTKQGYPISQVYLWVKFHHPFNFENISKYINTKTEMSKKYLWKAIKHLICYFLNQTGPDLGMHRPMTQQSRYQLPFIAILTLTLMEHDYKIKHFHLGCLVEVACSLGQYGFNKDKVNCCVDGVLPFFDLPIYNILELCSF